MAKEFIYRGKKLEELKEMDMSEFMKLVPARTRRSLEKGFTEKQEALLEKIDAVLSGKRKKPVKTHCRNMIILPKMIDLMISIYSGKEYIPVKIEPEMLGMRLGEFTSSRKQVQHSSPGVGATKSSSAVSAK
jgi:small subunit ribosomal protein S19